MTEMSNALCTSTWAKENGVLFYNDEVYIREDAQAYALLEMRRVLGRSYAPTILTAEAFDELLTNIWQQNSGVSQQLVDDMDADIDLMALTEEIPDNEDLLDNDENSPVIRLINAIMGEAVKEGASDIHIEPTETHLRIRLRVDGVLHAIELGKRGVAANDLVGEQARQVRVAARVHHLGLANGREHALCGAAVGHGITLAQREVFVDRHLLFAQTDVTCGKVADGIHKSLLWRHARSGRCRKTALPDQPCEIVVAPCSGFEQVRESRSGACPDG